MAPTKCRRWVDLVTVTVFATVFLPNDRVLSDDGNWPQWRGPSGTGASPDANPPTEWSETKNIAWKTAIPGLGWSSPVVANGKVWITTT